MKITIYELLGMVKDGKAPKKIKFENKLYHYVEEYGDYEYDNGGYCLFSDEFDKHYGVVAYLNDEVEIIEEEKKIPEKLKIEQDTPTSNYYIRNENGTKCALTKHSKMIAETLNQVIDYLKSKGE